MILIHFSPLRALSILAPRLIFEEITHGRGVKPCYACRCATTSGTGSGTALRGTVCFRRISCRLAASAAACQPGRDAADADADPLSRDPLNWVRAGARWLLAEMLLFFVPAVVAVVNYAQLLMVDGWRIFAVIALSTLMVLGATAWVVDKVYRFEISRQKHD
jgi:holin-like protein